MIIKSVSESNRTDRLVLISSTKSFVNDTVYNLNIAIKSNENINIQTLSQARSLLSFCTSGDGILV